MDISEVRSIVLQHFPDAEFGEGDDGEVVIFTGIKPPTERSVQCTDKMESKWYLQPCMRFADYCNEMGVDPDLARGVLRDSGIGLGGNDDALIRETRLCRLLGITAPSADRYMISLGD